MKNWKTAAVMAALAVAGSLCSCSMDDNTEDSYPRLQVDRTTMTLAKTGTLSTGQYGTFAVRANKGYTVYSDQAWLRVDKPQGTGYTVVTVIADENDTELEREGTLTICSGEHERTISVTQNLRIPTGELRQFYKETFDWTMDPTFVVNGAQIGNPIDNNPDDWQRLMLNNALVQPVWAQQSLELYGTKGTSAYGVQWGCMTYQDSGSPRADGGLVLPLMSIPDATPVEVSFNVANDGGANSGWGDTVFMVVEVVSGSGVAANGTTVSEPVKIERNEPNGRNWHAMSFTLTGCDATTRIAIHSQNSGNQGRFYIDDIYVNEIN